MERYIPAEGAPQLRTAEGEAFPATGKMIDPARRYYARMIGEGALVPVPDEAGPDKTPKPETDKPAAVAASSKKDQRK